MSLVYLRYPHIEQTLFTGGKTIQNEGFKNPTFLSATILSNIFWAISLAR